MIYEIIGKIIITILLILLIFIVIVIIPELFKMFFDWLPKILQEIIAWIILILLIGGLGTIIYLIL